MEDTNTIMTSHSARRAQIQKFVELKTTEKMTLETLIYTNGEQRATIVTNGEQTRTYTASGCRADRNTAHAIHRLTADGYYLDGFGTLNV